MYIVPSTTSSAAIEKLRVTFATHGLPEILVSDNGLVFVSGELRSSCDKTASNINFDNSTVPPFIKGLAERAVQTIKEGLKRMTGPLETRLSRFLLKYRVTSQATTEIAPTGLLMGHRIRTHLDLLYPTT